jgi:hypothetical protein
MRLEEVRTKKEFVDYTSQYGNHVVVCVFEHLGIRRSGDNTFIITFHREKHRPNWYNNTEIKEKEIECTTEECFNILKNEIRRQKIKKLKTKTYEKLY